MKLTKNFSLSEFACKDGTTVPYEYMPNVQELANNLQVLRDYLQRPIYINSAYRSPEHNANVGGSPRSQHLYARAADIRVDGMTPKEVHEAIESLIDSEEMKQGGLGLYDTFVHYDCRNTKARW